MSPRNLVAPATADHNRTGRPGGYTFHAPISDEYDGIAFAVAAIRLGDHAHLDVSSGRAVTQRRRDGWPRLRRGRAGRLVLRWHEWLVLREILAASDAVHVAEVENPSPEQIAFHAG